MGQPWYERWDQLYILKKKYNNTKIDKKKYMKRIEKSFH